MGRKGVLLWLLLLGGMIALALGVVPTGPKIDPFRPVRRLNPITYTITAMLVFTPPKGTKVAHVWLVKPPDDAGQKVLSFEIDPKPTLEALDPLYGNQLLYFRFEDPDGAYVIRYRLKIRLWELHWDLDPNHVATTIVAGMTDWLRNESKVVVDDPRVRSLAFKVTERAFSPFERARRIMLFAIDALTYSHSECSLQASALHALMKRKGHCSDYHGFSTALLRALGIPARVTYGMWAHPKKRRSPSHCKLEVFLPPYGWIPFDVSETDKLLTQLERESLPAGEKALLRMKILKRLFRGFRENVWFRMTVGTDFPVVPPVAPNPPVIRTAYIVCDDKVLPDPDPANPDKAEFAWQFVWEVVPEKLVPFPWKLPLLDSDSKP